MTLVVAFHALTRLLFAAGLCGVLRQVEGGGAPLTTFAIAAAAADTAIEIAGWSLLGSAARLAAQGAEPGVAAALGVASGDLAFLHTVTVALFAGAASAVILRTGVLPRWIGWIGIAAALLRCIAALHLAIPIDAFRSAGTIGYFLLYAPWTLASGVVLFRRHRSDRRSEAGLASSA